MTNFRRSFPTTLILTLALFAFAAGCGKKKTPLPPPPPPAQPSNSVTNPPEPPMGRAVIDSFVAEPSRVDQGQSATLKWSIRNATDMTIDPSVGAVQSQGSRQVFPGSTTTYTLTAKGPGGTDSRTVTVTVGTPPAPPPSSGNTGARLSAAELLASRENQDALFGYDKSDISGDAITALTNDADLLKRVFAADRSVVVVIEGHCDERGSAEYNLGLGDRRATAAKDFLTNLGVPGDRLKTISYGKERPQCTDADETCYQKNRRAHLAVGQ